MAVAEVLPRYLLHHAPILVHTETPQPIGKKPFRFEKFWMEYLEISYIIRTSWGGIIAASPLGVLHHKLWRLQYALRRWNKQRIGDLPAKVREAYVQLAQTLQEEQGDISLAWIGRKIGADQAEKLIAPFTEAEIELAVRRLPSNHAPGLDGFSWGVLQSILANNMWVDERLLLRRLLKKITKRLETWKSSSLNIVGRVVLIRDVLQTLPQHLMFAASLMRTDAEEIDRLARRFLWAGVRTERVIHYINWERVNSEKAAGGLGISRTPILRVASLAIMAYHVLLCPSMVQHVFGLKYKWSGNPWELPRP
ncbi:hypothetical protein QJS10_CPB12g00976 [Acorus calamus]|uniref:Reverse transcriptase n=1 Tax=Acorus calamus TaxID=4465 RepID=A0AAV9DL59_ACOCL|nr:hypothetical protein QJS10_CPB12g00976 [Acorus calamus]